MVGGKVEPEEKVDSFSSLGVVAAAVVEAVVGCTGAEVGAAWAVMVTVEVGLAVEASVAGVGASVLE